MKFYLYSSTSLLSENDGPRANSLHLKHKTFVCISGMLYNWRKKKQSGCYTAERESS
jgi:hypothetical protein